MKVQDIKIRRTRETLTVTDSFVGKGLVEGGHASLPDIDVDYASDRRQEIKEYLEQRYDTGGRRRVFSAGTFTTMQLKAALKDVARVHRVPHGTVNYVTAMLDDGTDWTGLFRQAAGNRKLKDFIRTYPEVVEEVRLLLGQPRAASVHASAIIVTPETRDGRTAECFDFLPVRKTDGMLVSEFDGYSVDEIGLLKEDVLATKELAKLSSVIALVNEHFGQELSIERITQEMLEDGKTYRLLSEGNTQNVFQFSSPGITRFIQDVQPDCIEDLIAINALYRPATLDIGATEDYIRYRRGEVAPVYDYGCYEATKNTFGIMCVAEDSPVVTARGNVMIQDMRPGESVLTEDGTYQKVLAVIPKGEKETVRIGTSFGEALRCTADHRVLTQYGWVEAGKLDPKIHLVKAYWSEPHDTNIGEMKDWCLGLYLANGSSVGYPATIACRNREDAETVKKIFDSEFHLSSVVYHNVRCWYVRLVATNRNNGSFSQDYRPNEFNRYLREHGLKGVNVYHKRMPEKPSLMLLAGMIEGDGCVTGQRVRLCNRELASSLYSGLQAHRIPSSYNESVENGKTVFEVGFNEHPGSMLPFFLKEKRSLDSSRSSGTLVPARYLETIPTATLSKGVRNNIRKGIAMRHKAYRQTVEKYGGYCEHPLWANVLSVRKDKRARTWDLSVDKNHSFCVGGLIVHNCYQEQFMSIAHTLGGLRPRQDRPAAQGHRQEESRPDGHAQGRLHRRSHTERLPGLRGGNHLAQDRGGGKVLVQPLPCRRVRPDGLLRGMAQGQLPLGVLYRRPAMGRRQGDTGPHVGDGALLPGQDRAAGHQPLGRRVLHRLHHGRNLLVALAHQAGRREDRGVHCLGTGTRTVRQCRELHTPRLPLQAQKIQVLGRPGQSRRGGESAGQRAACQEHDSGRLFRPCREGAGGDGTLCRAGACRPRAGVRPPEKDFPAETRDKHYFWSQQQIAVSGIGSIDYRRIFDNSEARAAVKGKASYLSLEEVARDENDGRRAAICATVVEVAEHVYKDRETGDSKRFAKLTLSQNNRLTECVVWNDYYTAHRAEIQSLKDKVVILTAMVRYSDYSGCNTLQTTKNTLLFIQQ